MNTTHESTFQYQAALEWSVPNRWAPQLRADLDELQAYRAAQQPVPDPAKVAAMKARALHAGTTKANDLHTAIDAVIELHRPQLMRWTGSDTSRAVWLTKLIYPDGKKDISGKPCGWRTVYNHLKTLSL